MYPPPVRRRTNSLGSGNEGQDEGRHNDQRHPEGRHGDPHYERGGDPRDPRTWGGYMPPPGAFHPEDMRRHQAYYDRMYQEYERYDYDRRSVS